jgi:DNA (cytosine-5)-methyltransferase 1
MGFRDAGFRVTGVDDRTCSQEVFVENRIGELLVRDLHNDRVPSNAAVVTGGPPCRPWSAVNMKRRGADHEDHALVERFFEHLHRIRPGAFLMENVPPLAGDAVYRRLIDDMRRRGYSVGSSIVQYSDFGAATTRKRLFTVGFAGKTGSAADEFFRLLNERRRPGTTVREAIGWLRGAARGAIPDHEWSAVTTIGKYAERYRSGRFGWKQLAWDSSAPSFGSVSKTYILHPDSDPEGPEPRVLSVREVLSIMGFPRAFRFPQNLGISIRYRMAANAVSPIVATECARVIRSMITGEGLQKITSPPLTEARA